MRKQQKLFYYSLILLSLVLCCFIILRIWLIGPYDRWSCWGYALGTLLLRSMPVRCMDFRGPYEGLILGLASVACAMLGAGGIRSHSNAWDDYHIYFKKKYILFILPFSDFLPDGLPVSIFYCLNCRKCCKHYDVIVFLQYCIHTFLGRTVINVVRTCGPAHLYGYLDNKICLN